MAEAGDMEGMAQWRERFLANMLRYAVVCGALVTLPAIWGALHTGVLTVVLVDIAALLWLALLWRMPRWPYAVRSWGFVILIYLLATWFLVRVGVVSLIYMAAFPVMTSALLGLRASVLALVLNGLTLMVIGYLAGFDIPLPGTIRVPLYQWFLVTLNFLFVNSIITTAGALVVRRLEKALERQELTNAALRREVAERQRADAEVRRLNAGLEERVLERTRQLVEANEELEAYSYTVSHDLRGPLNSISGFSQVLRKALGKDAPEQAVHSLARIRANVGRMTDLIEGLLSLAKLSRSPMQRMTVDLSAAAREIAASLAEAEPGRQVRMEIEDGLLAEGDRVLLRAVLANLIGNAWKFTGRRETARIAIGRAGADMEAATFFVRDNGAGFDMAQADRLFGTFQRLHDAEDFPGTGIGLATVRRIIALHGGRVWAQSAVGEGTTFYFVLGDPPG